MFSATIIHLLYKNQDKGCKSLFMFKNFIPYATGSNLKIFLVSVTNDKAQTFK